MTIHEILQEMTFEEKVLLLTGAGRMSTYGIERLGIPPKKMADGPHGVRTDMEENCTSFPNLCSVGATWDVDLTYELGETLAEECIEREISMLLAPGINIKRHILCGRNFEYFSEDPVVAGNLGAAYINGMQDKGVGTSLKHFACNNQEDNRINVNVDVDMRSLREIYLKGFEIAVKKSKPVSVMCAYNRVHSIWCSENRFLLTDVLRDDWNYEGFVISDWGAVHNIGNAIAAGLDLQMPRNAHIVEELKSALEQGKVKMEEIDQAVLRMLRFVTKEKPERTTYDRKKQHEIARKIASAGIVLLKNAQDILPITKEKYHKIAVIGEFADSPNICGQGSAEVNVWPEYIDSPLTELKKNLGDDVEIQYKEMYRKREYSDTMLWPKRGEFQSFIKDSDVVIMFIGSMVSEDTECFDRRSARFNPNYEKFIEMACDIGKKVIVVMQTGSAMVLGEWRNRVYGIVQMWLAGEGAGKAIADVLTGQVNPSGKLPETFPKGVRTDLDYPGEGNVVEYREKGDVGYRYYDKHPEEIVYPFGHGLSYSKFEYSELKTQVQGDSVLVSLQISNTGETDGSEVVQIYVGSCDSSVKRPVKELKAFRKVFVKAGETIAVEISLDMEDFAYYNVMLNRWVVEMGEYIIYAAASSQDVRGESSIHLGGNASYTLIRKGQDMIG